MHGASRTIHRKVRANSVTQLKKIAKQPPLTDDFEVQENFNALTVIQKNFKTGEKRGLNSTVAIKQKYRGLERNKRGK